LVVVVVVVVVVQPKRCTGKRIDIHKHQSTFNKWCTP
jgi:hypothetical protein